MQFLPRDFIEAMKGLIGNQYGRASKKSPRYLYPLSHADGKLFWVAFCKIARKSDLVKKLDGLVPMLPSGTAPSSDVLAQGNILPDT